MKRSYLFGILAAFAVVAALEMFLGGRTIAKSTTQPSENPSMVTVRLMTSNGTLSAPVSAPKLVLSDAEWKKRLTPEQYAIVRSSGTERAFCGGLLKNKDAGMYVCVACNLPLFHSESKFESGTGWPSFYQPAVPENVTSEKDSSYGMTRTAINCTRCDAHLGHVFEDGPKPTGLRYCMNSEALRFVKNSDLASLAEPIPSTQPAK